MRRANLNAIGILDASVQTTLRVASPWVGVLWITALPLRLLQLYFASQLGTLLEPQHYLHYLWRLSTAVFGAFLVSLYGRAVFVRACYLAQNSARDFKLEALKVPLADLLPYLYTALLNELFFYMTLFTFVLWPIFIMYGGLAAATSYGTAGPKLLGAPLTALKAASAFRTLLALSFVYGIGIIIAVINLYVFVCILLLLFGQALGPALPRWEYIFQAGALGLFPKQELTHALMLVGAALIVEPFWLAANVELVQKLRARKTGEDLQLWLQEIKNGAAQ